MAGSVILSEKKVIGLLRQFVREAGVEPCSMLVDGEQQEVPKIITLLHDEITDGNWSKALRLINSLAVSVTDLSSMKYSICKQRYLESINTLFSSKIQLEGKLKALGKDEIVKLVNPEQLKLVAVHLKSLEGLCSQEDYFKLSFLISCPDLKTHPNYSNWSVQLGRFQTASSVCRQVLELKYPALLDNYLPASKPKRNNRLLQLVAKGMLYEKCENLLQHRGGSDKEYNHEEGKFLDMCSWLTHLPDEVLHVPVHKLSLCIEEQCYVKSGVGHNPSSSAQQFVPSNGHDHVATAASTVSLSEAEEDEKTLIKDDNGIAAANAQEVVEDDKKTKEDTTNEGNVTLQKRRQNTEEDTEGLTKYHVTQEINTEINGYDDNLQQSQKSYTHGDYLQRRDVVTPDNCHIEVQPVVNSSTPKPSHGKQTVELPITSPIDRDREAPDYGPYYTPTSLRKQIITKNRSQFPRYSLVGTVNETQAVRTVAFESTGQFVAIGANSKSFRICSLVPLFHQADDDDSHDLPVLYLHPKYHKGSVYCLAWNTDGVIASGSNDQTIRLLRFDRDTSSVTSTPEDVHIHKGTIRDVMFLRNCYLSSAGAGDCAVKIYDCAAQQCIRSFAGHSSQVLTLSRVTENINLILSGGHDQNLILWDIRQPKPVQANKFSAAVTSVTNHNEDICISSVDGTLSFLELRQLSVTHQLQHLYRDECRSVSFSPNGRYVLSGSYEAKIQLTDVQSKQSKVVAEHKDKVVQCRWHSSGRIFASTSVDKHVCFWQAEL